MRDYFAKLSPLLLAVLICSLSIFPNCVQSQNMVSTYAGDGTFDLRDGDTLHSSFMLPVDMDMDRAGNLYVIDYRSSIRKIYPSGAVTTLAGYGVGGFFDGPGSFAKFQFPTGLCVDSVGNVYVSDSKNHSIRKIAPNGFVTTIAGRGTPGYKDTIAIRSSFCLPRGICIDRQGNLYIADAGNHRIRKLDVNGYVTTVAGGGSSMGIGSAGAYLDGPDTSARFGTPYGLEVDSQGNLYVADIDNHRIRKISPQGLVTTIAGSGPTDTVRGGYHDGSALTSRFNQPIRMCLDKHGGMFITDSGNNRIRYLIGNRVTTVAGAGWPGNLNGPSMQAQFTLPNGIVLDSSGVHCYVADGNNGVIRKLSFYPTVDTIVPGSDEVMLYPNPAGSTVQLWYPKANQALDVHFRIYDALGQVAIQSVGKRWDQPFSISHLRPGPYTFVAWDGKERYALKFVKE